MIKRKELRDTKSETWTDIWLPICRTIGAAATEFIGQICIDINFDKIRNVLSLQYNFLLLYYFFFTFTFFLTCFLKSDFRPDLTENF